MTFGSLLRRWRLAAGLSQEALAEAAGLSAKAVSDLERDPDRRPRLRTVTLLAEALDLDAAGRDQLLAAARPDAAGADKHATATPGLSASPVASHGVLPTPTSRLVGRAGELEALVGLLSDPDIRLVTITGAGGIGKTGLALEAAASVSEIFADGVLLVDLAAVDRPAYVASALLQAAEVPAAGEEGLDGLVGWLQGRRVLLLLDNFEHVVEAAPIVAMLLERAAGLTCLVTSRVRLHLSSEWEQPLGPLLVPDLQADAAAEMAANPAVELLAERALACGAHPDVTADVTTIAEICRRLDGIPLAIELAAAQLKTTPPQALLQRLTDPLAVLTGGYRDLPDRQRTLRDTIAWSHGLLTVEARTVFADLSVFTGEFTLTAAEAVCGSDLPEGVAVADVLAGLADHSLLVPVGDTGEARFRMLHVVREYARGQLEADRRASAVRRRHARFYLGRVNELKPVLWGPDEAPHLTRFDRDYSNVRVALEWALDHPSEVDLIDLATTLYGYWTTKMRLANEGLQWLQAALNVADSDGFRAKLLVLMGRAAWMAVHPHAGISTWADEALALCRQVEDVDGACQALFLKAGSAWFEGDHMTARQLMEEALDLSRRSMNSRARCYVLTGAIQLALDLGDDAKAASLVDEFAEVANQPGSTHRHRGLVPLYQAKRALFAGDADACLALLPDLDSLDWDEGQKVEVLTLHGAAQVQRERPDEAAPFLLEAFRLASDNHLVLDVPATLHGLGAVAALYANTDVAATLAAVATTMIDDDSRVATREELEIFLPVIAEETRGLTAIEWQTYTTDAQQLLERGLLVSVTELTLSLSLE